MTIHTNTYNYSKIYILFSDKYEHEQLRRNNSYSDSHKKQKHAVEFSARVGWHCVVSHAQVASLWQELATRSFNLLTQTDTAKYCETLYKSIKCISLANDFQVSKSL